MQRYQFFGYRRENGRVGVRNYVVILPVDEVSNAACEAVANNIKGTLAFHMPTDGYSLAKISSSSSAP